MHATTIVRSLRLTRLAGIAFGCFTQVLFAFTVWKLFWFLKNGPVPSRHPSLFLDVFLALQFAVPHSILLLPGVKKRLTRYIRSEFYGLFFCSATCLSLLAVVYFWQSHALAVWDFTGPIGTLLASCYILSWFALYYSISLTGLGYQTGFTPWSYWLRGEAAPPRGFATHGAYRYLRHPIYLSFLGLIWFTPRMTLDHALLTTIWTVYIYVGSMLKDRRLEFYIGDTYRRYTAQVPGYPLFPFGRLSKRD